MSNRPAFTDEQLTWLESLLTEKSSRIEQSARCVASIAEMLGAGGSEPEVTGARAEEMINTLQSLGVFIEETSSDLHALIVLGRRLSNDY
ncbi:hypothetical protein M0G74_10955 [Microbulbifer sp. CAU 1566]|uniref:hypothetical protein n=1 Tax=Microbulbifer sp. CAU 1566 TaxID=2933269 RepID=UPI002005C547|nr:hypothetical protein [Microbulbifer sp. CAU 1566]MCK7597788.1 hypothetical protein [Microbulbifer sp. CAU 1566]